MLARDRLEIFHHEAVSVARAQKNSARLGAPARHCGEGFADFLPDAFHHAAPESDRRRAQARPFDWFQFQTGSRMGTQNGK